MPIHHSIWKIGDNIDEVKEARLSSEEKLEDILQNNIEILNENWLIIGRQVRTKFNKSVDLLALDNVGSLIIIELKKKKTPRETVAQGLDYASWVKTITSDEISEIFETFSEKYLGKDISLNEAYFNKFQTNLDEDNLNGSHQIVIVAPKLDSSTERIVTYLSDSEVPINAAFFKVFEDNNHKYISRAWMIDPYETADIASTPKTKEPWNGEFYVSFGIERKRRDWNDAREFGFISAGGGLWYSRTLYQLNVGDRVWANIPHVGYVGVGIVSDTAKKATDVIFSKDGKKGNIYKLSQNANYHSEYKDDDKAEYIVKIDWLKTSDIKKAMSEIGFFGNQNTVCKPTTPKWTHTVNRLKEIWKIK